MSQARIFGGSVAIYNNPQFKAAMNIHYSPLETMKASVALLKASPQIDLASLQFGQYQPILSPQELGTDAGLKRWMKEMGGARLQLSTKANTKPLSNDQPDVVPLTMCCLLDACVRKCFNSDPPICMQVNVTQKAKDAPNPDLHDIVLEWEYGTGSNVPTLLNLTMVCPYVALKS